MSKFLTRSYDGPDFDAIGRKFEDFKRKLQGVQAQVRDLVRGLSAARSELATVRSLSSTAISFAEGFRNYGGEYPLLIRERNGVVEVRGLLWTTADFEAGASTYTGKLCFTMPAGLRPASTSDSVVEAYVPGVGYCKAAVRVKRTGEAVLANFSAWNTGAAVTTIPAGTWVGFDLVFLKA